MFNSLYNFFLFLLLLLFLPKLIFQLIFKKKYKKSFLSRLGFPHLPLEVPLKNKKRIWIHAVSVGEIKAIAPLAKQLSSYDLYISTTTETGLEEAKRSISFGKMFFYLPFDFSFSMKSVLKKLNPDLILVTESDFWYSMLLSAKKRSIPTILVNGKISERSFRRFHKIPYFSKKLFSLFDHLLVQSEEYHKRFTSLGISSDKMIVTGNLKNEGNTADPEITKNLKQELHIQSDDQILIIASTHDGEEKQLLKVISPILETNSKLKILIAPRHPERFNQVEKLLKTLPFKFLRYSQNNRVDGDERLILIDTLGTLVHLYPLAQLSIIGGSYVKGVGGHNLLESIFSSTPVVFGPYMDQQKEMAEEVKNANLGSQLPLNELKPALEKLLAAHKEKEMNEKLSLFIEKQKGSLRKSYSLVQSYLERS